MNHLSTAGSKTWISRLARVGLIAKGIVYVVLGILAFMAAFEVSGQSDANANRSGVFRWIKEAPGGQWWLPLLAAGLICYSVWRLVEAFRKDDSEQRSKTKRARYVLSGLGYAAVAFSAIKMALETTNKGDQNQQLAATALDKPFGQWMLGIGGLVLAGIGIYQVYYALSEKYKKHVQKLSQTGGDKALLLAGKVGYIARGLVWIIIAFLLLKAALHANASEAGDSGKAFQWLESGTYGSLLLGILGLGVIAYGVFNFVRARYERFE
ncbi:MAG: hypothetical protein JWP88_1214 [Flaviaesturariibacter sp.]|nr:hypothetical protein [Flaviaesturariibacter sp.]